MTVGRRWRLRCHSVPPADRRCFPSSAVLPQPLLASLALGVSPWAHGRGMDWNIGSPDFDRDRIICHVCACDRTCTRAVAVGRRSFFRHSEATSNEFWLLRLLPFAMALHSSGLCWLPSLCFAWCQWPSAFSAAYAALLVYWSPLLKLTVDVNLQDTWSRLIA